VSRLISTGDFASFVESMISTSVPSLLSYFELPSRETLIQCLPRSELDFPFGDIFVLHPELLNLAPGIIPATQGFAPSRPHQESTADV
jgi:hypothetical protein